MVVISDCPSAAELARRCAEVAARLDAEVAARERALRMQLLIAQEHRRQVRAIEDALTRVNRLRQQLASARRALRLRHRELAYAEKRIAYLETRLDFYARPSPGPPPRYRRENAHLPEHLPRGAVAL